MLRLKIACTRSQLVVLSKKNPFFRLENFKSDVIAHVDQDSTQSRHIYLWLLASMCRATTCVSQIFPVCVCWILSVPRVNSGNMRGDRVEDPRNSP
jgi:hypothetical protein